MSAHSTRTALVAGGSAGIGLATAARLARDGMRVVITGRDSRRLLDAAAALRSEGIEVLTAEMDTTSPDCSAVVAGLAADHGLDILVNCVGSAPAGTFDQVPEETWLPAFDTKVVGAVRTMRGAVPHMLSENYGRIVNVAGSAGREPDSWMAVAGAANAALMTMTKAASSQLAADGITVNAVCPGPVRTGRWDGLVQTYASAWGVADTEARLRLEARIPRGAPATADEVASLIHYLVSDEASHITGTAVTIDGGQSQSI